MKQIINYCTDILWNVTILLFKKEIITFIKQRCIELVKSDSNDFDIVTNCLKINPVLLNFIFILKKNKTTLNVSTKILNRTAVFNINSIKFNIIIII